MKNLSKTRITALAVFAILLSLGSAFAGSSFSGRSAISSVDGLHIWRGITCHPITLPTPIRTTEIIYLNKIVSVGGPFKVALENVSIIPNNSSSNVSVVALFKISYDGKTRYEFLEPNQEITFYSGEGALSLKLNSAYDGFYYNQRWANITTVYTPHISRFICAK